MRHRPGPGPVPAQRPLPPGRLFRCRPNNYCHFPRYYNITRNRTQSPDQKRPMSNNKSTKLQPMAIRVTPKQFQGLQALKDEDGISVQDHIRRALDNYLRRQAPPTAAEPRAPVEPVAELPGRVSARQPAPVMGQPEPIDAGSPPRAQPKRQQVVFR